jgi:hypothetical protein
MNIKTLSKLISSVLVTSSLIFGISATTAAEIPDNLLAQDQTRDKDMIHAPADSAMDRDRIRAREKAMDRDRDPDMVRDRDRDRVRLTDPADADQERDKLQDRDQLQDRDRDPTK